MERDYKISRFLRLLSGVMLLFAFGYRPYFYYIILRWVVSGSSLYSGWVLSRLHKHNWAWLFFIVGILFNPIFPFYLDRSIWQLIDLVIGILFFYSLIKKIHK